MPDAGLGGNGYQPATVTTRGGRGLVDLRIPVRVGGLWDIPKLPSSEEASKTILRADIPLMYGKNALKAQDPDLWVAAQKYLKELLPMAKSIT